MRCVHYSSLSANKNVLSWRRKLSIDSDGSQNTRRVEKFCVPTVQLYDVSPTHGYAPVRHNRSKLVGASGGVPFGSGRLGTRLSRRLVEDSEGVTPGSGPVRRRQNETAGVRHVVRQRSHAPAPTVTASDGPSDPPWAIGHSFTRIFSPLQQSTQLIRYPPLSIIMPQLTYI